jgi:energy-coupling factor transporter ATP-binding protein EcfA2
MRDELRGLYARAGKPTQSALKQHADAAGHTAGRSTLIGVVSPTATGTLKWQTVEAFTQACLRYAHKNGAGGLRPEDADMSRWQRLWEQAYPGRVPRASTDGVVEAYLARLRQRYGHLDIESLLPLDSQQEQIPIGVREVFVAQKVRSDPPPVDLPRELWHRLAESGALDGRELPDDLDGRALAELRRSYEARPAKPVLQVLAEPGARKLVVLGDPGAGKSTLARYLAVVLAADTGDALPAGLAGLLPVLIELRDYAAGPGLRDANFLDYLERRHHGDDRLGLPRAVLEPWLRESGRVLVVFDGLDELFDAKDRETVTHQITGFAARYPGARVLLTSRHVGYRRGLFDAAGFGHFMLQDLDRQQIGMFAQRWYRIACPADLVEAARLQERLLTAIDASRSVRELAGNPLLLTILAVIGRRQSLPRDRHNLYKHAVTVLVEHWEVSKHLAATDPSLPVLDREDKLELLRLIARRMQDGKAGLAGNHIAGVDLMHMFETYLRDGHALAPGPAKVAARAMIEQFQHRNFILSRFGSQVYGFVHRTFLEYLAAEDIDIRFGNRELSEEDLIDGVFGRRWKDPAWHEVLLLLTGIREHFAGRIIDRLLIADPFWRLRPDVLPQHVLLAVRCLAEVRKPNALASQSAGIAQALTQLLETLRTRVEDPTLTTAIEQTVLPVMTTLGPRWPGCDRYLTWYHLRGHITPGGRLFPDYVALPATRIAAALDHSDSFRQHLHVTATRPGNHQYAREAAVKAIAASWPGDPDTLPWLREFATTIVTDDDTDVRWAAVQAIAAGWPDDPDTLPWLRELATTDSEEFVRRVAVEAIAAGWPDDPDTLPLLRERATTDARGRVRQTAVRAIAAGWPDDPDTLPLLHARATTDANWEVRQTAVRAIAAGWPDDPDALPLLRERATTDSEEFVRRVAVEAIAAGWPDDPDTLPLLRERATTDNHHVVRWAAVEAIAAGWPDDPDTLPWLHERATNETSEAVRLAAIQKSRMPIECPTGVHPNTTLLVGTKERQNRVRCGISWRPSGGFIEFNLTERGQEGEKDARWLRQGQHHRPEHRPAARRHRGGARLRRQGVRQGHHSTEARRDGRVRPGWRHRARALDGPVRP